MEVNQKKDKRITAFQLTLLTVFIKPMAFSHLSLFRGPLLSTKTTEKNKKSRIRMTMENIFKIQDIGRRKSLKVTSRKAAPLGDPRGVPKYFRKCFYKAFLKSANKRIEKVILLKFENSVKIIIVKTTSSNFLLTEVKMNFNDIDNVNFGDIPQDILDFIEGNSMEDNIFNELDHVLETIDIESGNDQMQELSPQTISIPQGSNNSNNLNNEDQNNIINPIPVIQFHVVPIVPMTINPSPSNIILPSAPVPLSSLPSLPSSSSPSSPSTSTASTSRLTDTLREARIRNNEASRKYRDAKKVKLEALGTELESLSQKNERLVKQEREMRNVVETLKRSYKNMIAYGQQSSVVSELVSKLTDRYLQSDQSVEVNEIAGSENIETIELDNGEPSDEPSLKRIRLI